jgi:acyl-CoA reductase-like NAD-dependent aldehyde dehydrogenase
VIERFVRQFASRKPEIAEELSWQMGRPIAHSPFEVGGMVERATHMAAIAPRALSQIDVGPKPGFTRFIRREPVGVVLVLSPWNFPFLTAVNAVIPALLAGNTVVLKHSEQTPLCPERMAEALSAAGLPAGALEVVHASHEAMGDLITNTGVDYISFTGSVAGGDAVCRAAAQRRIGVGLELGGKDPAYVRADADLAFAVENIADGAYFNAGQSCCGV